MVLAIFEFMAGWVFRGLTIFVAALLATLSVHAQTDVFASTCDQGWEQINNEKSVIVCSKKIGDDEPLKAFRGASVINAPVAKVAAILFDPKLNTDPDTIDDQVIKVFPGGDERIEYTAQKLHWPAKPRDFVLDISAQFDPAEKSVTINIHSVSEEQAATLGVEIPAVRSDRVRGEVAESYIKMTAIDDNTKTEITVGIQADPKGSIPKSVVNSTLKSWPVNMIAGLAEKAVQPGIPDEPEVNSRLWAK